MSTESARDQLARALPLALVLALATLLGACTFPSGGCRPEELVAPTNLSPGDDTLVTSLTPTLTWSYEGACEPDGFRIAFSSSLEWPEGLTAEVEGSTTWWVPPDSLQAAKSYSWTVTPRSGSTDGPRAGERFRTGPLCDDPADYAAPVPVSPPNGSTVELAYTTFGDGTREPTVSFRFVWDNPGSCLPPDGYRVEVHRSPAFPPDGLIDEFGSSGLDTLFFIPPGVGWAECARYYWRVSPILPGSSLGPASETWSFITPSASGGICLPDLSRPTDLEPGVGVPPTAHGAISGYVWHDECAVPYESTDIAPPGCVIMPDGGLEANGVLDPGEAGIEGVTVRLASGACPGAGGWSSTTDVGGHFSFHNLSGGTYCLSIDAAADGNDAILIPGNWTVPYRWYGPGPVRAEVTLLGDDDIRRYNDFAWDYQFLPAPAAVTPSAVPMARVLDDSRCRSGPGMIYPVLTYLSQGLSFPIQGRNTDSSWWWVARPDGQGNCWLADNIVEILGDAGGVPLQAAPPTPTVTPVLGCWVQACPQCPNQCIVPCPPEVQQPSFCTP